MGQCGLHSITMQMLTLLSLFLVLSFSSSLAFTLSPGDLTVPSCFQGDTTWDQDNIYSVLVDFSSPEECQQTCQADPACVGFTWTTENSDVIPLACVLFSELGQEAPCQNCVSGPPECRCSIAGECEATGENVLDVVTDVSSEEECANLCANTNNCTVYTYMGELNPLRHMCFLFSSCDVFTDTCVDCSSGVLQCNVCHFQDTMQDGTCAAFDCTNRFEDSCYLILKNIEQHNNAVNSCREECKKRRGHMGSIHSEDENTFVLDLVSSPWGAFLGLAWSGTENVWEDGSAWDFQNFGKDSIESASCFKFGFNPDGSWSSVAAEKCFDTRNQPTDCFCKRPV